MEGGRIAPSLREASTCTCQGATYGIWRGAAFDDILRLVREEADSVGLHSDEAVEAVLLCRYAASTVYHVSFRIYWYDDGTLWRGLSWHHDIE